MSWSHGAWTLGRFGGAPVRLHWSLPLGMLVMSGFSFLPAYWLGFVLLVLVHEAGHALVVLHYRLRLLEIMVHGFGGYCSHGSAKSELEDAAIAWGGVLLQLVAFGLAELVLFFTGAPTTSHGAQLAHVFTHTNLWLIALNLLPVAPLDGRKAWPLVGMLWRRRRAGGTPRGWGRRPGEERAELAAKQRKAAPAAREETPSQRSERLVRDLISRTTGHKPGS